MPTANVTVKHRCGCERVYSMDMPRALQQSVVAQIRETDCKFADCPLAAKGRLLASRAPASANGKGEP